MFFKKYIDAELDVEIYTVVSLNGNPMDIK
jgi:hypothetical protein